MSEISRKLFIEIMALCRGHCCKCGTYGIQIHHIDENHENHEKDNLIPLCPTCHSQVCLRGGLVRQMPKEALKKIRDNYYEALDKNIKPTDTAIEVEEKIKKIDATKLADNVYANLKCKNCNTHVGLLIGSNSCPTCGESLE